MSNNTIPKSAQESPCGGHHLDRWYMHFLKFNGPDSSQSATHCQSSRESSFRLYVPSLIMLVVKIFAKILNLKRYGASFLLLSNIPKSDLQGIFGMLHDKISANFHLSIFLGVAVCFPGLVTSL